MAWPESLTANQQAAVEAFATNLRSWAALLAQINIVGGAISSAWNGGISTMVGTLQTTDVIPNTSGLAGAQDLLASDVTNLANWASTLANSSNSVQGTGSMASVGIQQTCVKACGINAAI